MQSAERVYHPRRGFRLSPVSNHHVLAAYDHLTHLSLGNLSTGFVYDQHLHPRHGRACRIGLPIHPSRIECRHAGGALCLSVPHVKLQPGLRLPDLSDPLRRQPPASDGDPSQVGQVRLQKTTPVHQRDEVVRHAREARDARPDELVDHYVREDEVRCKMNRPPAQCVHQELQEPVHIVERDHHKIRVLRGDRHVCRNRLHRGVQVAVGEAHAFGCSGAPRRVNDGRDVRLRGRRCGARLALGSSKHFRFILDDEDSAPGRARSPLCQLLSRVASRRHDDDGLTVVQNVAQCFRSEVLVEMDRDRISVQRRPERHDDRGAGLGQQTHAVSRPDAPITPPCRQGSASLVQLGKGEALVREPERQLVREPPCDVVQPFLQQHRLRRPSKPLPGSSSSHPAWRSSPARGRRYRR